MSEENKQDGKLDERRKTALLRYIAVLFAVAFLLVLASLLGQMRDTKNAITELNQSSTSALQRAEQLQDRNRELEQELADRKELEAQLAEAQRSAAAYEQLLLTMELVTPGAMEGNVAAEQALDALEQMKDYLGPRGLEKYESLLEEVE